MKLIGAPISVRSHQGIIHDFVWRGRHYQVLSQSIPTIAEGKWWMTPQLAGISRYTYTVRAKGQGPEITAEIVRETSEAGEVEWRLERIQD